MLNRIGIPARRKRTFQTATKQLIEREVGYAILRAEGFETTDEVVFAQPGDRNLLGVRTLEGFGVRVDNVAHRFVATTTLVASLITTLPGVAVRRRTCWPDDEQKSPPGAKILTDCDTEEHICQPRGSQSRGRYARYTAAGYFMDFSNVTECLKRNILDHFISP